MDHRTTPPRGSRLQAASSKKPSFTTQRLSLIVDNRRRRTWEKPEPLEIKSSSAASGAVALQGAAGRSRLLSAPSGLERRRNSWDESQQDDTMSVTSDTSVQSEIVFSSASISTPVKSRHLSESSQYSSSPDLSPVSKSGGRSGRLHLIQSLNGMSQSHAEENAAGTGAATQDESNMINSMGRRAYYRAKKSQRSPTSRKFDQLLKGNISSSLEHLTQVPGTSPTSPKSRRSLTKEPEPDPDAWMITRSLDSNLDAIHTEYTYQPDVSKRDHRAASHVNSRTAHTDSRRATSGAEVRSSAIKNHLGDLQHIRTATYDPRQDKRSHEKRRVTTGDSDLRDCTQGDAQNNRDVPGSGVPKSEGQTRLQPESTPSGLKHNNPLVNANTVTKESAVDGNMPAGSEVVHNDSTCSNQRLGAEQSLKSDSTLRNNADQRDREKCSNIHHEGNSESDREAFLTNNSNVARERPSPAYVYDGSLMSPLSERTRQKAPASIFAKKGPSVFRSFSRFHTHRREKEATAQSESEQHVGESERNIAAPSSHSFSSQIDEDDEDNLDNNCLLSEDNEAESLQVNARDPNNNTTKRDSQEHRVTPAGAEEAPHSEQAVGRDVLTEADTELSDANVGHDNDDSLDHLDDDMFSPRTRQKQEKEPLWEQSDTKNMKNHGVVASGPTAVADKFQRSQSVRELTTGEKDSLEKTGTISGFPLSRSFFQAPVGRSGSLPSWRRWSSQTSFEAVREERESDEEDTETRHTNDKADPVKQLVGTNAKNSEGDQNDDDKSTSGSESEEDLSVKFVDYFKRNGKVAIHTDGNQTVMISNRGSFKNISYNPEFTAEGLQLGTHRSRSEVTQLDLPEEDRPSDDKERRAQEPRMRYSVSLPDAVVTESSDAITADDSLEKLDSGDSLEKLDTGDTAESVRAEGTENPETEVEHSFGTSQNSQKDDEEENDEAVAAEEEAGGAEDYDEDSVLKDGSLSDLSHRSSETSDNATHRTPEMQIKPNDDSRPGSETGFYDLMYNAAQNAPTPSAFRWHSTQSSTDLRPGSGGGGGVGETESETSSVGGDTISSQGYDSSSGGQQQNLSSSMDDIRLKLSSVSSHLTSHLQKKQQRARSGSLGASDKAPSVSEASIGSSRASRPVWARDRSTDVKPISNPALRNKLGVARTPGTKVTSRDQKILELMLAKREGAKNETQKREAARVEWETEKQRETQARISAENARRRTLSEHRRLQENRRTEALHKKLKEEEAERRSRESAAKHCDKQWLAQSNKVLAEKEARLAEKRRHSMERKKSAEERLQMRLREEEEHNRAILEKQERQIRRANSLKHAKEAEQLVQKRVKSIQSKKKQEERKGVIERQSREDLNHLQSQIDAKLKIAEENAKHHLHKKTKDLRRSMHELDARLEKSRENQQRMEEELGVWRNDLMSYRKTVEQKAEEQARQNLLNKKKKAVAERIAKERAQKQNMKKLMQQEEEWKMDVEATLAMKEARARTIQMEKEELIQESRAIAHASQRLREELRQAYSADQIDQLSRRAELEAKIVGNTASSSQTTKNKSSLTLG